MMYDADELRRETGSLLGSRNTATGTEMEQCSAWGEGLLRRKAREQLGWRGSGVRVRSNLIVCVYQAVQTWESRRVLYESSASRHSQGPRSA
jgi:hypothetical protein